MENTVRKGEIACNKQFLLVSVFLPYMTLTLNFKCILKMLSAICFNLDQSKILSSGNGLKYLINCPPKLLKFPIVVNKLTLFLKTIILGYIKTESNLYVDHKQKYL